MDPNPVELFLHIVGVIGVFVGYGMLVLGVLALGRVKTTDEARTLARLLTAGRRVGFEHISLIDVIVVVGVLLIAFTGLHMAAYTGDWTSGWSRVAIGAFVILAPVGPLLINPRLHAIAKAVDHAGTSTRLAELRSLTSDPVLTISLRASLGLLVAIVFLMTVKPPLEGSVLAVIIGTAIGAASAVFTGHSAQPR